jgi:hypothetical protein
MLSLISRPCAVISFQLLTLFLWIGANTTNATNLLNNTFNGNNCLTIAGRNLTYNYTIVNLGIQEEFNIKLETICLPESC